MRFTGPLFAILAAFAVAQQNAINVQGSTLAVTAGQPTTITWTNPSSGTVTIKLQQGSSILPGSGLVLASGIEASAQTATFTIPADEVDTFEYTIEIVDDTNSNNYNFSPNFNINGATGTPAEASSALSYSASATASASASSGTATTTGTATSSGSTDSASTAATTSSGSSSASATTMTATTATSSTKSSASSTTASASTAQTSAPNSNGAGVNKAQGALLALLGAAVALF